MVIVCDVFDSSNPFFSNVEAGFAIRTGLFAEQTATRQDFQTQSGF